MPDGSTQFRLVLPPEMAANFQRCLERAEDLLFAADDPSDGTDVFVPSGSTAEINDIHTPKPPEPAKISAVQRRADAAVAMAESSLAAEGIGLSSADRYQVVVHLDADVLDAAVNNVVVPPAADAQQSQPETHSPQQRINLPQAVRIALQGGRSLTVPGVRRMVCDASLVTQIESGGTPVSIGTKTRVWPEPMRRACIIRDGHTCAFPGCTSSRWLDVHHCVHWLDGGETSMDNGVTLCRSCHTRVHDEGWTIERLPTATDSPTGNPRGSLADRLALNAGEETIELVRTLERHVPSYRFTRESAQASHRTDDTGSECCAKSQCPAENHGPGKNQCHSGSQIHAEQENTLHV
jgi:hypothetical protein